MALALTPAGPDKDGCWSGAAFIDNGVRTFVYTGVFPQVQCLATSDDDMTTWKKVTGNPVVGAPPAGLAVTGFRDPSIWREGDSWLMTVGSGFQGQGGAILLYGIPRVVVGENRTFVGEEELLSSRRVAVELIQNEECIRLMEEFIRLNPTLWNEDIGV